MTYFTGISPHSNPEFYRIVCEQCGHTHDYDEGLYTKGCENCHSMSLLVVDYSSVPKQMPYKTRRVSDITDFIREAIYELSLDNGGTSFGVKTNLYVDSKIKQTIQLSMRGPKLWLSNGGEWEILFIDKGSDVWQIELSMCIPPKGSDDWTGIRIV